MAEVKRWKATDDWGKRHPDWGKRRLAASEGFKVLEKRLLTGGSVAAPVRVPTTHREVGKPSGASAERLAASEGFEVLEMRLLTGGSGVSPLRD